MVKHIKQTRGDETLSRVIAETGAAGEPVFSRRIQLLDWYPYDSFVAFLRAADRVVGEGDLAYCRTLGMAAAERDLSSVFSFIARIYGPERLIRSCSRVWGRYYQNAGRMEAVAWSPEDTRLRIAEFPEMQLAHCRLMEGWMWGAMKQIGARVNDDGRQTHFMGDGDPYHEFACTWTR